MHCTLYSTVVRGYVLCSCDLLKRPGARCLEGACEEGARGTLSLDGWTYGGGRWGAASLLEGRANMSREDGAVLTGECGDTCLQVSMDHCS